MISEMAAQHADVFSVFCRQITASWGEHLITPLIDDVLLCFLPFGLLSADVPQAATASGALLGFTRQAYGHIGGFAAVRGELIEDVAIARRARQAGLKLGLVLGGRQAATRMYRGYGEVLTGMSRGLLPVTGGSRTRLVLGAGWHLIVYTLPWVLAPRQAWVACPAGSGPGRTGSGRNQDRTRGGVAGVADPAVTAGRCAHRGASLAAKPALERAGLPVTKVRS